MRVSCCVRVCPVPSSSGPINRCAVDNLLIAHPKVDALDCSPLLSLISSLFSTLALLSGLSSSLPASSVVLQIAALQKAGVVVSKSPAQLGALMKEVRSSLLPSTAYRFSSVQCPHHPSLLTMSECSVKYGNCCTGVCHDEDRFFWNPCVESLVWSVGHVSECTGVLVLNGNERDGTQSKQDIPWSYDAY